MVKTVDRVDSKPSTEENHEQSDFDKVDSRIADEPIEWALEHYNISHKKLAKYYIFNHYSFKVKGLNLSPRNGTDIDVNELQSTFKDLNCEPGSRTYKDLELEDVQRKLTKISQADFSEYSALIVVILSHGEEGIIYAKDKSYKLNELWKPFITEQSNVTLVGKPKIFIIQACQGTVADPGVDKDVTDAAPTTTSNIKIPVFADFLFLFSSPPGFCAFRGDGGSWMVQTLCKGLREFKDQLDLQSIVLLVKRFIAYRKRSHNPQCPEIHEKKQIPFEASTFTRKFYLTKTCLDKYPSWVDEGKNVILPVPSTTNLSPLNERSRKVSRDSQRKPSLTPELTQINKPLVDSFVPVLNSKRSLMMFGIVLVAGIFLSVFSALICAKWFIN